jgi:hypothetical protein
MDQFVTQYNTWVEKGRLHSPNIQVNLFMCNKLTHYILATGCVQGCHIVGRTMCIAIGVNDCANTFRFYYFSLIKLLSENQTSI